MKSLNWGIIGPGAIANDFAEDLQYLAAPQHIKAVLGRSSKSTREFAKKFSVPSVFLNLEDFAINGEIDVAYIATPHTAHFNEALTCLVNKIPVLCEKPLVINARQCQKLIQASSDNRVFLMEGMWIRFLPPLLQALRLINDNAIGNLISVKASMGYKAPYDPESRYFDPQAGGGSLLDLGAYPVFLASLLLGNPVTIKAISSKAPTGIDISCSMIIEYENGRHAILESSLDSQSDSPAEITGEKGFIRINHPWFEKSPAIELHDYDGRVSIIPCNWMGHGLHFEAAEVLRCLENSQIESELMPQSLSLRMMETMDRVRDQIHLSYEKSEETRT